MPVRSRFPDVELVDRPVAEEVMENMLQYGNTTAIVDGVSGRRYSFSEVVEMVRSVEVGLHGVGLRKGDVGVVCMPNCPEYVLIFLAMASRGGITSGINSVYTEHELKIQFKDSKCKFVFTVDSMVQKVRNAAKAVGNQIKKIYVVGSDFKESSLVRNFTELLRKDGSGSSSLPKVHFDTREDVVLLPYSSGTTGVPKGVMLTHFNMLSAQTIAGNRDYFHWPGEGDFNLAFLPFFHIFGFLVMLNSLRTGVVTITLPQFHPEQFLQIVQDYKLKMLFIVPPVLVLLAKHPMVDQYDLSSVEAVFVGAAPVGKDLSEELLDRHPSIKYLIQAYGMTEEAGGSHIMPPTLRGDLRHGSCGVLVPNYDCKVIDVKSDEEVGANKEGEILVRSVCIMKGYLGRLSATAATVDQDGWLHTGDIGYYDEEGYFYVVDRLKELIKVKGFQVAPAELEDLLLSHPFIQDVAVIGIPDPVSGESPRAFVVSKPNSNLTSSQVQDYVKDKVAPYKQLKGGVEFMNVIPKSPSGKILRRLLRDEYAKKQNRAKI